ncbi:hypothetical protein TEA_028472 [Camellia sinensis var. sinensis]|uniref:OPA3-like protein n=1 Tax=Camellia sinensis var. sinensis TaxID=542762 RepID=A0A4S4EAW0_CAMSN|nr:hypothetical protein TEA_028472 [Camellia sinensis var. sinensis]
MVLPLLKLGTLVLKTLSKPIASRLKKEAGKHPKFRKVIVDMAQANHRLTTRMQRRIYSHATDVEIRPLNEEKAVQAAVDLLGEFFVFSVAGVALILEVQRSARSEAKKEELRQAMFLSRKCGYLYRAWHVASPMGVTSSPSLIHVADLRGPTMSWGCTPSLSGVEENLPPVYGLFGLQYYWSQYNGSINAATNRITRRRMTPHRHHNVNPEVFKGMRQKDEELAKEIELLKKKLQELEQLARGQGLAGVFNIRRPQAEDVKSGKPA